ncbi:MAG: M42 family peptidase, partial [Planctomycetota bacterium]
CTVQGAGAALTVMDGRSSGDPGILADFERLGQAHAIPTQRSILARGGTDTAGIQQAAGGTRAFTLSCPTRYIHTTVEMVHLDDLHACRDLLAVFLADVK